MGSSLQAEARPDVVKPGGVTAGGVTAGDESLIILQSLLCVLREKNLLTRADIEELCHKVEMRAAGTGDARLPCSAPGATAASSAMQRLTSYLGQRYGGKHARGYR